MSVCIASFNRLRRSLFDSFSLIASAWYEALTQASIACIVRRRACEGRAQWARAHDQLAQLVDEPYRIGFGSPLIFFFYYTSIEALESDWPEPNQFFYLPPDTEPTFFECWHAEPRQSIF